MTPCLAARLILGVPHRLAAAGKFLMVVSLCAALGLHWAALQSIAWAGMLLNYSRAGSVTEAFEKTFDGRHPCPLCRALSKSQESGKKPEAHWPAGKLDLEYCEQACVTPSAHPGFSVVAGIDGGLRILSGAVGAPASRGVILHAPGRLRACARDRTDFARQGDAIPACAAGIPIQPGAPRPVRHGKRHRPSVYQLTSCLFMFSKTLRYVIAASLLSARFVQAHGFEGDRFFPPTIQTDDPFAVDELAFPTLSIAHLPASADTSRTREIDLGAEFDKEIFPRFALGISGAYTTLNPRTQPSANGFQNFSLSAKYELLEVPAHEFIFSVGAEWELGGTGGKSIGADSFSTISPAIYFGKGFGDLPESVSFLRPLALTGVVAEDFPTEAAEPNTLEWGFALEYSLPYLEEHVKDTGLPHPFREMIPLVEFALETPENRGGGSTTGSINPGVLWESKYFQLGGEAVIPFNRPSGRNVGFVFSVQIYIDDLFPQLFGHPIFFAKDTNSSVGGAK